MKFQFHSCFSVFSIGLLLTLFIVVYPVWGADTNLGPTTPGDQVHPEFAKGFTVEYFDTYKVVTVYNPWKGSNESFTYVLIKPGTTAPSLGKGEKVIEIPTKRFISLSTTYLAYLPVLGVTNSLVGVQGIDSVSTPEVISRIKDGSVMDVSGGGTGMGSGLNLEKVIQLDPDLVMAYATGMPDYDQYPKLEEAHIPVVLNGEYMEENPLGRAEWIKFASVFFDREKEANEYFDQIKKEYQSLAGRVSSQNSSRPSVFLNNNYKGTWYMAGGNSYVARLLKDAGSDYLWSTDTSTGSTPLDFEVVYDTALKADYWLDPGTATSIQQLLKEDGRYSDFAAVQSKKVFNNNARLNSAGGNDYWESGVTHPEILLNDLVKIFHPDLASDHEFVYYRHLE